MSKKKNYLNSSYIASIGREIRRRRHELDWSQMEAAKRIGITNIHLCNVERGKRSLSLELLCDISRCFGCSPRDLMPKE